MTEQDGRYISLNGDTSRSFSSTPGNGNLFQIAYKDYSVGMTYVVPVQMKADSDIQEELITESVSEPEETEGLTEEEYFSFEGQEYTLYKNEMFKVSVENPEDQKIADMTLSDALKNSTSVSRILYQSDDGSVDFIYENYSFNTKESILIHERQDTYIYAFLLDLKGLIPVLQDNGSVILSNEAKEEIFEIPAPVLEDSKGIISEAAEYKIINENDQWLLSVSADSEWMNEEERAFPVTLDPSILARYGSQIVTSTYVCSSYPDTAGTNQEMYCGYNDYYGECRVALRIASLPAVPSDCMPVRTGIAMLHAAYYDSSYIGSNPPASPILMEVHEANNGIANASQQTWNTLVNQVNPKVLDYQKGKASTIGTYLEWDISSAGLNWYENHATDRGLIFIAPNAQAQRQTANLFGSHYPEWSPVFIVTYRNATGIESYYSYREAGAARAGNVYISDYTNQLTVSHTDLSFNSEITPFTLSHVYNSEHAKKQFTDSSGIRTKDYSSMIIGSGWKLSAQQTVIPETIGDTYYLIYNDADGTEHYFRYTSGNTYEDEDGLNLTITQSGNTYTMSDQDGDYTWIFFNGYLIIEQDRSCNRICYAYNNHYSSSDESWKPTSGSGNRLVQIVSIPVDQNPTEICRFGYTGNNLTSIIDYAGRTISYSIVSENSSLNLKSIQYPSGAQSVYTYDSSYGWMDSLYDTEAKYGLEITRRTRLGGPCVNMVREYTSPSYNGTRTYGNAFHAYRNSLSLTSYRFYGADHISQSADDTVLYTVLDHWGRTICSYETDSDKSTLSGVSAGSYTANSGADKKNNRLTSISSLGMQSENIIEDGGAESGTDQFWHGLNQASTYGGLYIVNNPARTHTGQRALQCTISFNSGNSSTSFYQDVTLEAGNEYVFSGYINTDFTGAVLPSKGAYLKISTVSDEQIHKSRIINHSTYTSESADGIDNYDGGWEKVSVSFIPETSGTYRLSLILDGARGSAYGDDFQLEKRSAESIVNENIGAGSTNLLSWGSFEKNSQNGIYQWSGSAYSLQSVNFLLGQYCVKTTGDTSSTHRLTQTVPVRRSAEDITFVLSGWGKADSIASAVSEPNSSNLRYFGLIAAINYTDNTTENHYVSFSPEYHDWQYASGNIVPKKPNKTIQSITVSCAYDYNANTAYFDNISLVREPMQTYSYDSEGKLQSVKDGDAYSSVTYVSGTHLPETYTTPGGLSHTLTYTSNHLLETDTLSDLVTSNSYSSAGLLTSQKVKSNNSSSYLFSSKGYSNHYLTSSNDANNISSSFTYNTERNLKTVQTGTDDIQRYSYSSNEDRIQQSYISGKGSLTYNYENGSLSLLQRKSFNGSDPFWQRYHVTRDSFGNMTEISVSGSEDGSTYTEEIVLAEYGYEDYVNNGRLKTVTWPNGDSVTYEYDLFDRVKTETYEGSEDIAYEYTYDGTGSLSEKKADDEIHAYQYDSLGRLSHSQSSKDGIQSINTTYLYDIEDRLKIQKWNIGSDAGFEDEYTYSNTDSTLSSVDLSISLPDIDEELQNISSVHTYTPLRQIKEKSIQYDGSEKFHKAYAYHRIDSSVRHTNQIEYLNYRRNDDSLITGNKYLYDSNGRLSSLIPVTSAGLDSSKAVTYTYDSMGQLTGCTDQRSGSTVNYTYSYDTAGNIRSSTGDTSKTYYYENTSWPDLLTKVKVNNISRNITYPVSNGKVISGTPLTWFNGNNYTFTWKHGTQLATASKGGITASYSYDMDGIRNSKTVGSTVYHFDTLSGKVMHQTGDDRELWFIYDENGQPYILISKEGSDVQVYWYLLNAFGDVIGLLNSTQQIVSTYRYDPYGRIIDEWINPTDDIGTINPLRYRGYYYDSETGFYYLQSRYYDPEIGRFISNDSFATTDSNDLLSSNMFAYCLNDPVNRIDAGGNYSLPAAFVVGFVVGGASQMITNILSGQKLASGLIGAAFGGGTSACVGVMKIEHACILAGFAGACIESLMNQIEAYDKGIIQFNALNVLKSAGTILYDTFSKGMLYVLTGALSNVLKPIPSVDSVELITMGPSQALWTQFSYQNAMLIPGNIKNNLKDISTTSNNAGKSVMKPATVMLTRVQYRVV